jgi:2-polyprenyl-3-methyl-5-hydroxy-6-metoxy-1,4-benzoquinol methylase
MLKFFADFAMTCLTTQNKAKKIKVLEIACNDGSQLDAFKRIANGNIITVGVDPAKNIYDEITSKKDHDIWCEFFSQNIVDKLIAKYGTFDIIVAQNVFAHVSYPNKFLYFLEQLMHPTTELYIQTSQKNMIIENQFDTVYHEHISFFNTNSMKILCEANKLYLNSVNEHSVHGTSYIFNISKTCKYGNTVDYLDIEDRNGLYNLDIYNKFRFNCIAFKNRFCQKIENFKLKNTKIIAFGSTAKSMTIFNFCDLTYNDIDIMIDENPLKQNQYTPGSHIKVVSIDVLKYIDKNTVIIITAWNFYDEIKKKIAAKINEYEIQYDISLLNLNTLVEELCETKAKK